MFIPTGVPEEANANISSDVKSGLFFFYYRLSSNKYDIYFLNVSHSKSLLHGRYYINFSAFYTKLFRSLDSS